jgi:uncharacterized sporulation protein YeaH/YhbH (DUF444 family)
LIGRQGKDLVRIPVPQVDLPHFTFGKMGSGGVGQGPGQPGDILGPAQPGDAEGGAGEAPGQHLLEAEISIDELVQMLAEELELPRIQPKGNKNIQSEVARYTDIRRVGPESLRHFKRTYREALKRQLIAGLYNPENPIREDRRYRSFETKPIPEANAVIIYMMDVSGSMGEREKRLVRMTSFWIDAWLKANYRQVQRRYIVHDAAAAEVDEETFYHLHQSGGTKISSALEVCQQLVQRTYAPSDWNIYLFQFSDGDNFANDNDYALDLLVEHLIPAANLYCYGQVDQRSYGESFLEVLEDVSDLENVAMTRIPQEDAIYDAIKLFLGKGK